MNQSNKINNNLVRTNCPCCNSEEIITLVSSLNYLFPIYYSSVQIELESKSYLSTCKDCSSIFKQNAINEEDSIRLYSTGKSSLRWNNNNSFLDEKTADVINILRKYVHENLKILDVGCSTGRLLDYIKSIEPTVQTFGIEYSNESQEICIKKGHQIVDYLYKFRDELDIIVAFDVVEHIYDFPKFLTEAKNGLKSNGFLIILTGNPASIPALLTKKNWWYYNFPEHILFPSVDYFKNMSEFSLQEYKKVFNAKSYKGSLLKLFYKLIYYFRLNNKYIGLPSFMPDHHLIILKKNG